MARATSFWLRLVLVLLSLAPARHADAARLRFRAYGESDGLWNMSGRCLAQTRAGYLLVCSEAGVFAYDGRRFENLGPAEGLTSGGLVREIAVASTGRVAVRYSDRLFVSDQAVAFDRPPNALHFRAVDLGAQADPDVWQPHRLAPWKDGFVIALSQRLMRVVLSRDGAALAPMEVQGEAALERPQGVFNAADTLWATFTDGRVCAAAPRAVRCFGPAEGLAHGPYVDVEPGSGTSVLARSSGFLATIDGGSGAVAEEKLPFQGGPYDHFPQVLRVSRMPTGNLVTQTANGLMIRTGAGWRELTAADGVPDDAITALLVDAEGELWLKIVGDALFRGVGIGHWEALQHDAGLSKGSAWQIVGTSRRSLWVSTDTGVDEVRIADGAPRVVRTLPGASFGLAMDADGQVWTSVSRTNALAIDPPGGTLAIHPPGGALAIHPPGGAMRRYAVPGVKRIVAAASRIWFGTLTGLYVLDRSAAPGTAARADTACGGVRGLAADGAEGAWLICDGTLWHRHAQGRAVRLGGLWPSQAFLPLDLWPVGKDRLWVAGAGGLYDVRVDGDRIVSMAAVPAEDLRTSEVYAVMVDHRGWLWVGTDRGLSAFDGRRWVSSDATTGLPWNDLSQSGLHEDEDGSMWIGTSKGLAHLLDPASLFATRPLRVVISRALLGGRPIASGWQRFTNGPLSLQFGVLSFASEASTVFRYRLSGVDRGWVETASGSVGYPSVPPGRHVLTVVGYNPLTRTLSEPATMTIGIGYPWWRGWWAEALYGAVGLAALRALLAARDRVVARKQRAKQQALQVLVDERTREMRAAQAELRRLATTDGLTGLLNRREIEARLRARLGSDGPDPAALVVAMLDIDHFKRINDRHGHLVGDAVLQETSARVTSRLGEADEAGRYGGEEILLLFDNRDGQGSSRIARLHRAIRDEPFAVGDAVIPVTCSIGAARTERGDDWSTLVGRADAALYQAKCCGRNRVVESAAEIRCEPVGRPVIPVPASPEG